MTARIEKTVFISYRHTNYWTALAVFQNLNAHGYDVFLDYKSIPSGDFEQVITENIKSRTHFIVILSPSALERCNEPRDWLRKEIETAIEAKRNIIPLMIEGFDFGNFLNLKALTGKLVDLKKYNGMSIPAEYFDEAMAKLRSDRFLNRPLESVRHPISELTKKITKEIQEATSEEREVNHEQLINQEGLEQEYIKSYPLYHPNSPTSQVDRFLQDLAKKWELLKPRIMFSVDCQLPSDIQIKIHEQWLTTSLNNVIRNAINAVKANPAVQPIIVLRGMINGDKVRLEVEDNGSGIPEQISPRIFRDVISNIKHSETGRGLLLTRFILETNGGNIFIKKSDKKGTIIAIDVPIFHATPP